MLLVECEEKQKIGQNKKMVTREIFPVVHIALIFIHQKYYLSQRVVISMFTTDLYLPQK